MIEHTPLLSHRPPAGSGAQGYHSLGLKSRAQAVLIPPGLETFGVDPTLAVRSCPRNSQNVEQLVAFGAFDPGIAQDAEVGVETGGLRLHGRLLLGDDARLNPIPAHYNLQDAITLEET